MDVKGVVQVAYTVTKVPPKIDNISISSIEILRNQFVQSIFRHPIFAYGTYFPVISVLALKNIAKHATNISAIANDTRK